MGPDGGDLGRLAADGGLDLSGGGVGVGEGRLGRQLEMQARLGAPVDVDQLDVVDLAHALDALRCGPHPFHQRSGAGLDVDDGIDARQDAIQRLLDPVGHGVGLGEGGAGGHRDDDVGPMVPGGAAQAQPADLEIAEGLDRGARRAHVVGRGPIQQDVGVLAQAARPEATSTSTATTQRGDGIPGRVAGADGQQPDQHRQRAGHVAGEVHRARRRGRRC